MLCHIACEVPLSVCRKYGLRCYILTKFEKDHDLGQKEHDRFGQFLLPFSAECCTY
jgi:hypothetical protein